MFDFKKAEDEVLDFWKKNKIYEKSKKKNSRGKKFYFMDGPPYATGHIHIGTALNKFLKDIALRYNRLQGFDVFDRPGYDTHGVPIEFQVEKEIGLKTKQDIEKFGVKKFIDKCKKFATQHTDVMNSEFEELGVWMDWKNPYLTLNDEYMEGVWTAFKAAEKKNLLYLGKYPVHLCTRCETAVSFNEIEYAKQKDTSVFVKFPLKEKENTSFLIWTTTPWTLPANAGIMVNPGVDYQEVEVSNGERWIIAKDLVPKLMELFGEKFSVKKNLKGKEMEGWTYENPLSRNLNLQIKNGYKVVLSSRYVTTEEGTGLVHCAPGHGKEDYEVGKENGLDSPCPVGIDGLLTKEAGKYEGKKARVVDGEIIEDLEKDNALVYKLKFEHDYPLCWRCKTPLLMVSLPQWFLRISGIQKKLLKDNEKINWVPTYMKARMKAWLEGIGDWPVSRQRYWGTPLPIWFNEETGERIVVGSLKELQKLSGKKNIDLHKPGIDNIKIKGKKGKMLTRVPDVLDVWFDAGASSWAVLGYPGKTDKLKKYWPSDLNIEGKDQFRGWWNSQMILSEITFGKLPFKNIGVHGMVLDVGKNKMSKSVGNVIAPKDIIEKYSRDFIRYYFAKLSRGEDFSFDERNFKEIQNIFRIFVNINSFVNQIPKKKSTIKIEDKWILSKLHSTIKNVGEKYKQNKFHEVTTLLETFLIENLSRTYIQIIRDRSDETYEVLNEIRLSLVKIFAPIIPLLSEITWQELRKMKLVKEESVHLSSWPKENKNKINNKLEKDFADVMKIIESGLAVRDKEQIGLKWPLSKATISYSGSLGNNLKEIVARQLNVKKIELEKGKEIRVKLDLKSTPELEAEGFSREISRKVQAKRKKLGLQKIDKIELKIWVDEDLRKEIESFSDFIKERTGSKKLAFVEDKSDLEEFEIKKRKIGFLIKS